MSDSLWPYILYSPWISLGQINGVCSLSLFQGIFPTQGLSPGLWHCWQILYHLRHKGSPRILEWVAYPFSWGSPYAKNWTGVSCIAGRSFTNWTIREASCKFRPGYQTPVVLQSFLDSKMPIREWGLYYDQQVLPSFKKSSWRCRAPTSPLAVVLPCASLAPLRPWAGPRFLVSFFFLCLSSSSRADLCHPGVSETGVSDHF